MINVCIKREKSHISHISISGHALFAEHGKDIVCAGVSSIIIGGINAIHELGYIELIEYDVKEGEIDVKIKDCFKYELQVILETLCIQLKTIEESYSNYIIIQEV